VKQQIAFYGCPALQSWSNRRERDRQTETEAENERENIRNYTGVRRWQKTGNYFDNSF
jgi:hypothetical protein